MRRLSIEQIRDKRIELRGRIAQAKSTVGDSEMSESARRTIDELNTQLVELQSRCSHSGAIDKFCPDCGRIDPQPAMFVSAMSKVQTQQDEDLWRSIVTDRQAEAKSVNYSALS